MSHFQIHRQHCLGHVWDENVSQLHVLVHNCTVYKYHYYYSIISIISIVIITSECLTQTSAVKALRSASGSAFWHLLLISVVTKCSSVRMYVCMSPVTLMHPAKSVGQNEMSFDRTLVWSQVTCVRQGPWFPHRKGRFGSQNAEFAAMPPVTKLLVIVYVDYLRYIINNQLNTGSHYRLCKFYSSTVIVYIVDVTMTEP